MSYPITQQLIPGLPKNPYRHGASAYEGVVAHSTDNTAPATNERDYEASGHWQEAFVHFFVDWTSIIQVADTDYVAWGCGPCGNPRFVQVELCQTADPNQFNESYNRYVWLLAKILYDKKLGVTDGSTLVSHDWVTKNLGGTTHSDPIAYLTSHGVSWQQFVKDVAAQYTSLSINVQSVPNSDYVGKTLTSKVDGLWYYNTPKWDTCDGTSKKGDSFIITDELMVNGGRMVQCHDGKYRTADPAYVDVNPKPLEWPYTVQVDGVTLKEAQEIVIYIGQNYKNAKAQGVAK